MRFSPPPLFIPWITADDKRAVLEALSHPWLTGGPIVSKFEKSFAEYVGTKNAVACSSCTAALHMVMLALDIGSGDEVIVPDLTFAATANAALFVGAEPVFADIDERTLNVSPGDIQKNITSKTKAIIVVHYGGQPCDMKEVMEIAEDRHIPVVEDCAHSLGARYMNRNTGSIGTAGCFSFYPTKNITTLEGGMVTTNDDEIARRARLFRDHGMTKAAHERQKTRTWVYDVVELGFNYRLNEVQAALGMSQLKRVEEANKRRIAAAQGYNEALSRVGGVGLPHTAPDRTHVYHLYVVRVLKEFGLTRDELFEYLSAKGIGVSVHYIPLHLMSLYKNRSHRKYDAFPVAEQAYKEILSLPLFPTITKGQVKSVISSIRESTLESVQDGRRAT